MNIGSASEKLAHLSDSRSYLIAFSGGVDSHVLLHALAQWRQQNPRVELRALHVNHGLSQHANEWARHCAYVCERLNIPFLLEKIQLEDNGESLEAEARRVRYQVFAAHLTANECLLTAHHQDDQAETLLLQLLRGAGPKGLAAMPERKPFAETLHLRPLLDFSQEAIEEYAREHQLSWVDDDSNTNTRFDRNYLRHYVMPMLKQRWPAAINNIARSAAHCARATDLLNEAAENDFIIAHGTKANTLSVSALLELSAAQRANVLRHWFSINDERLPSAQQLQQLEQDVLRCDIDASPIFKIEHFQLRRYRDDLYLVRLEALPLDFEVQWDCRTQLELPGDLGTLDPENFSAYQTLTVRFRQENDSASLKKVFQQKGIPPWRRDRTPLVFDGDRLIAVFEKS